jgi:hypothetical protein
MNFSIFKIFQIFGLVSTWANQALADGKITLDEAVDLAMQIAKILGVAIEIELPAALTAMAAEDVETGKEDAVPKLNTWEPSSKPDED